MFVFDGRFMRVGRHDGISRFSAELLKELSMLRKVTVMLSEPGQLAHLPQGVDHFFECKPTSIMELGLARRLNRRGVTLLYSPMQTTGKLGRKFKVVLTLHDLIYYQFRKPPQEFSLVVRALWRLYHLSYMPARALLKGADGLVTISETSKQLIRENKLFSGPMQVVYNSAELIGAPASGSKSRTICYMGSFMPYKDVETLVRAAGLGNWELNLLSQVTPTRRQQLEKLAEENQAKVLFHNGVSDEEYAELLSRSFALVSASRAEGFGIPLIEAMRLGVPVVCTDSSIFREVGGEAALYFEAGNSTELSSKLSELQGAWDRVSKASKANAERFSWSQSAKELNRFLESVS
ncbi:MAG: hypothetical protein RLZZ400_288 [Actinomycetota bacterium]|jgi:glycosyltransferase involved in cell wall biosynthesis